MCCEGEREEDSSSGYHQISSLLLGSFLVHAVRREKISSLDAEFLFGFLDMN